MPHTVNTLGNLAMAYCAKPGDDHAENLETAIEYAHLGLEQCTSESDPREWARLHHTLGTAYQTRVRGERADNIEIAIHHFTLQLSVEQQLDAHSRWSAHNNLGNTYVRRIAGRFVENVDAALSHLTTALEHCSRERNPEDWATAQINLGNAYRIAEHRPDHFTLSAQHATQALEIYTLQSTPLPWSIAHLALAATYSAQGDPDQVAEHTRAALEVLNKETYPRRWAEAQANLAAGLRRAGRLEEAVARYREALSVYTLDAFPADYERTNRQLAELYFSVGIWAEAHHAAAGAIAAGELLLTSAYTDVGQRSEVSIGTSFYALRTYCSLKMARYEDAALELDRGKARLMANTLAQEQVVRDLLNPADRAAAERLRAAVGGLELEQRLDPTGLERRSDREIADNLRTARSSLAALLATAGVTLLPGAVDWPTLQGLVPRGGFLLMPMVTDQGTAVLLLSDRTTGLTENNVVWLDDLTRNELTKLLLPDRTDDRHLSWFGAYARRRKAPDAWLAMIESSGRWLWDRVMGPVDARLRSIGAQPGAPLLILPQGGLGVLPWHAAWREEDGSRRYLIDDYCVLYAPGAYALQSATLRQAQQDDQATGFLGVIDPTEDLRAAAAEGELVSLRFPEPDRVLLDHVSATREAVITGAGRAAYLHFSCHGVFDPEEPHRSALLVAAGERVTLADVSARLRLEHARLVCLSACETGITEPRSAPDEFLGLPAAFHQAGAPVVVSTLWAIDDRITMLLMDRFYREHRAEVRTPHQALREAAIWLRDLSPQALTEEIARLKALPDCPEAAAVGRRLELGAAAGEPESGRPYAHPYFWAAFCCSGMAA